jgi:hypothetical protein
MIANEGRPLLAATAEQSGRPVLGNDPWGHVMPQPGQLRRDLVLTPKRVFGPQAADECAGVRIDGRSPDWVRPMVSAARSADGGASTGQAPCADAQSVHG